MILSTTQHESFFEGEKRSVQSFRFSATFIVDRKTYKKRGGSGNYQKNVFGGCRVSIGLRRPQHYKIV